MSSACLDIKQKPHSRKWGSCSTTCLIIWRGGAEWLDLGMLTAWVSCRCLLNNLPKIMRDANFEQYSNEQHESTRFLPTLQKENNRSGLFANR